MSPGQTLFLVGFNTFFVHLSSFFIYFFSSSGLQETRKAVNLKVAVLSTDMKDNTVVAGTYDKKVVIMDRREEVRKMTFYRSHSKPVLGLRLTDRHILSLSEDRTLVVYDRAAGKR